MTLSIGLSPSAQAQWVKTSGPGAGSIECLAVQDTNLYAGTAGGGILLSTDLGTSWKGINNGLTNTSVWSLAISPSDTGSSTVFAATYGGGIFRSSTNDTSWTKIDSGLSDSYLFSLAISPNGIEGSDLFAGTEGGALYRSTNGGDFWSEANPGITNASIETIFVHDSTLLIGMDGSGIYIASDHGTHWTQTSLTSGRVRAFAQLGTDLFAGIYNAGVFISTDSGATWSLVDTGLTDKRVEALAVSGSNLFASTNGSGIYVSSNNGENWTQVNTGLSYFSVQCLIVCNTSLLAGVGGLVYRRPLSEFTSVAEHPPTLPREFRMDQNFPNPFNPSTTIRFSIPARSRVHLSIFNLLGQRVVELADETMNAGNYERTWTPHVASGPYFYAIEAASVSDPNKRFINVKKMLLVK